MLISHLQKCERKMGMLVHIRESWDQIMEAWGML